MLSQQIQQVINNMDPVKLSCLNPEQRYLLELQIRRLQSIELQKMAIHVQKQINLQNLMQAYQKPQGFKPFQKAPIKPVQVIIPQRVKPKVPTFGFFDEVWKSPANSNSNSQQNEDSSQNSYGFEDYNIEDLDFKNSSFANKITSPESEAQGGLINSDLSEKNQIYVNPKNRKKFEVLEESIDIIVNGMDCLKKFQDQVLEKAQNLSLLIVNHKNQEILKHKNLEILAGALVEISCQQLGANFSPYKIAKHIGCKPKTLIKMIEFVVQQISMQNSQCQLE